MTRKSQRLSQKTAQTNKSYDQKNCKGSNRRLYPNQQMTRKRWGTGPRCLVSKSLAVSILHAQCRSFLLCPPYCIAPSQMPSAEVPCYVYPAYPVPKFLAVSTLLYCPVPSAEVPCCVHPIVLPCAQCRSSLLCPPYCTTPCPVPKFLAVSTLLYCPVPSAEVPCCVHPIVLPRAQCRSSLLCPPYCTAPCPVPKFLAVSTLLYCPVPSAEVPCCVHPIVLPRAQCRSSLLCPPYCTAPCPVPKLLAVSTQHAQCRNPLLCSPYMPSAAVPCCVHHTCPEPQFLALSTIHAQCRNPLLCPPGMQMPRAPATASRQRSNRPFINTVTAGDEWGVRAGALSGEFRRSVSRPVSEPWSLAGPVQGKGRKWMSGPVSVLMK